ncbi:hypothetical protein [Pseudacidovorax intermedius]|uniref:hypothetical protein n=1 Tax=Pseudacidovorax intermedius TaxID=433924 RepID=UPI00034B6616|nr:hypothetical protein [Pseudacidovorax intermedius]
MARILSELLTGKKNGPLPNDGGVAQLPVSVVMPAVAPAVGDLIELVDLPQYVDLMDYDVIAPQLDSNGAPTLALSIGEENAGLTDLATVYEAGLTPGRGASGNLVRCGTAAASQASNAASRRIALKVTTAAATYAGAGKTVNFILHLRG